jgi:hypothetical protein
LRNWYTREVFDLEKLIPKLPAAAIYYWDCFLGICFVLAALFQGVTSSSARSGSASSSQPCTGTIGLLLSGFGLITFSMARQCWHYVGAVRLHVCSPQHKRSLAYPKVLASMCWLAASWVFFRYAALSFQITAQWIRRILYY